jgi:Domain of unknown function (DUF4287)
MPTNKPQIAATPTEASKSPAVQQEKVKGPVSYFPSIERTYGKPISEWKTLIRATGMTKHGELVTWLKTQHGIGHGHANALVAHTLAEQP